jgi:hypothetical protein
MTEEARAEKASAEELGRIERPEAARFKGERKLYVIPLLFAGQDAPPEFAEKFDLYWRQVGEQIANQEARIGRVRRIYHESIALGGEDGMQIMARLNPPGHLLAAEKCGHGAVLEAVELAELADECMDWERFLMMGFLSQKVGEQVTGFYREASKKRYEHMSQRIDESLDTDEVAILFIRDGHMVQFPEDVEVFMVAPPALDAIHRWLRDRQAQQASPPGDADDASPAESGEESPDAQASA